MTDTEKKIVDELNRVFPQLSDDGQRQFLNFIEGMAALADFQRKQQNANTPA